MALPRSRKVAIVTLLLAGSAVAATGITYAATTTTTKVVYACANGKGTLRLLTNGRCPTGFTKVGINKTGPRGPRGPKGVTGPPGPGALAVSASSTTSTVDTHDLAIPGMGMTLRASCAQGHEANLIFMDTKDVAVDYDVIGYDNSNNGGYLGSGGAVAFPAGLAPLEFHRTGGDHVVLVVYTPDPPGSTLTASVALKRLGNVDVVRFDLWSGAEGCYVRADVTPA
jgi:hypothetical protein